MIFTIKYFLNDINNIINFGELSDLNLYQLTDILKNVINNMLR